LEPATTWALTLREIELCARAYARREREKTRRSLWAAWHSALFERVKKLPELSKVMSKFPSLTAKPYAPSAERLLTQLRVYTLSMTGRDLPERAKKRLKKDRND
jgi:hypothetical protein